MRKSILLLTIPLLLCSVTLFYACNKKDSYTTTRNYRDSNNIMQNVYSWLDKQKTESQVHSNANIDLLKVNLNFSKAFYEELQLNKRMLIVPINEELAIKKNIDKNRIFNLVAILDPSGNILNANVVIFKAKENILKSALPENTFSNIYKSEKIDINGQFKFLSVSGNFLYQLDFDKGRPHSWGRYKTRSNKPKSTTVSSEAISQAKGKCTNYYLVLTYYVNGVVVEETWTYIGQICEGEICGGDYESICPPGESGGGSGEIGDECCIPDPNMVVSTESIAGDYTFVCGLESINPITQKPKKSCNIGWKFSINNLLWYNWGYISDELATFEKEDNIWKFTEFIHTGKRSDGAAPPCITAECDIDTATPSIDAGRLQARMHLFYTLSISYCTPLSTPSMKASSIGRNFTHR